MCNSLTLLRLQFRMVGRNILHHVTPTLPSNIYVSVLTENNTNTQIHDTIICSRESSNCDDQSHFVTFTFAHESEVNEFVYIRRLNFSTLSSCMFFGERALWARVCRIVCVLSNGSGCVFSTHESSAFSKSVHRQTT